MARRQGLSHKPPKLPKHRPGKEGGARDLNRRENLRGLSEAALALFLADGTAAVTIDQIVGKAGMAKGSFYRYVADKAELVGHLIAPIALEITHALDRCAQALRSARRDALTGIYVRLAVELSEVIARHPSHILLYLQEVRAPAGGARAAIHAFANQLTARVIELTEIARDHGLVRDVDPRVAALIVTGAVDSILYAYLRDGDLPAAEIPTVTRELVTIVLRGIGAS